MRSHFKHSVELVDRRRHRGHSWRLSRIPDGPGHVPGRETTMAEERIRLSQQTRIVEDSGDPH